MKPIVIETTKDLNELVMLLMSVNYIPEGKGVAMLLDDFESVNNFEAIKRWTLKTLWEKQSSKEELILNDLCEQLKCALHKGLLDVEPSVIQH
ncbi:MAG: hypothetical protein K6L74_14325 [Neptuniibacter sp.]